MAGFVGYRPWLTLLCLASLLACSAELPDVAPPSVPVTVTPPMLRDASGGFVAGHLLLGYHDALEPMLEVISGQALEHWPALRLALVQLPADVSWQQAARQLQGHRQLRYAHGNEIIDHRPQARNVAPQSAVPQSADPQSADQARPQAFSASASLNSASNTAGSNTAGIGDPDFVYQWHHQQLRSQEAWALGVTGRGIRIAIHDDLVDHRHPELLPNIDPNVPGFNGFTGELITLNSRHDGISEHGTAVAGAALAAANDLGGRGVAFEATLVPLSVNNPEEEVLLSDAIIRAALFAVNGPDGYSPLFDPERDSDSAPGAQAYVHIVNMSWGGGAYNQAIKDAMDYMLLHGVVLVNSAGNTPTEGFASPSWYPGMIAVAATTPSGARTAFSNRGQHVSVAAPGQFVWLPATRRCVLELANRVACAADHGYISGTSFSSPFTAGVAALILEASAARDASGAITGLLRPAQVRQILEQSARPAPHQQGFSPDVGFGLVDAAAAVRLAQDPSRWPLPGARLHLQLRHPNSSGAEIGVSLIPLTAGASKYVQTSAGQGWSQAGEAYFLEINPGAYLLVASGTREEGFLAARHEQMLYLAPGQHKRLEITLSPR